MTHTQGPWHTDDTKSFYVFAHGSLMEQDGVKNGPFICNASSQANARLIAAAPELLTALKEFVAVQDNDALAEHEWEGCGGVESCALCMANAAIAKAEGR